MCSILHAGYTCDAFIWRAMSLIYSSRLTEVEKKNREAKLRKIYSVTRVFF